MKKQKKPNKHRLRQIIKILLRHKLNKGLTPVKVRETLEDLGPTYVKIGQIMSTREDMLPKEYCVELEKLKENVCPLPYETIQEVIEAELGKPVTEIFASINEKPIGSASIGQVHRAKLLSGTEVVLKVMRPGIHEIVDLDFALLKKALKYADFFSELNELESIEVILNETYTAMLQEMDFANELNNLLIMAANNQDLKYIGFPIPYPEYSNHHLLVMEYIEGIRIDDVETLSAHGYDPQEICTKLVDNYVSQIIDQGVFHADPHNGNIVVKEGKIIWFDLGMIGKISPKDRQTYKRAIKAVIDGDVYEIKNIILSIGVCHGSINHAKIYQDIEIMMNRYMEMSINDMDLGVIMEEVLGIARNHSISLPKGMTMLGRSIVIIQKVIAVLDPKANLMDIFGKHIKTSFMEELDIKKRVPDITKKIYRSLSKSAEIPSQVYDLLNLTIKGQKTENVEIVNLKENVNRISRVANRLIIGLIISSMTLALGIMLAAVLANTQSLAILIIMIILIACGLMALLIFLIVLLFMINKDRKK